MTQDWIHSIDAGMTVCDKNGIIIFMNEKAQKIFAAHGGKDLIGKDLRDCHPGQSKFKLEDLLQNPRTNAYTIEKGPIKKMIYQTPWFDAKGEFAGLVEMSLQIPLEIPHFVRS